MGSAGCGVLSGIAQALREARFRFGLHTSGEPRPSPSEPLSTCPPIRLGNCFVGSLPRMPQSGGGAPAQHAWGRRLATGALRQGHPLPTLWASLGRRLLLPWCAGCAALASLGPAVRPPLPGGAVPEDWWG